MFIAVVRQKVGACGYSFACGEMLALWHLQAKTRKGAINELKRKIIGKLVDSVWEWNHEEGCWASGAELLDVTLFQVSHKEMMPVKVWYADAEAERSRRNKAEAEKKERAELERLKRKYND